MHETPIFRQDIKLRGELMEGASFTLLNLVLRVELLAALRLPLELRSGTVGKLTISGLDAVASRSGRVVITLTDVTFVFATPGPDSGPPPSPEELVACRRTLLEVLSHGLVSPWPEATLQAFAHHGLGAVDWRDDLPPPDGPPARGASGGRRPSKRPAPAPTAAARAKAAEGEARTRFEWAEYALRYRAPLHRVGTPPLLPTPLLLR